MKTYQVNLLNGLILIIIGMWVFLTTSTDTATALIPVAFGSLFVITVPPFRSGNPLTANILTLLCALLIIALSMSLWRTIQEKEGFPILPLVIMLLSSCVALIFLIRHRTGEG